tara:strand:- start:12948 stop:13964 length:1017 start_codon:yes stop_codon:yes gene_type:complete
VLFVNDYAFLKTDSGQFVCGFGPFSESATPCESGVAFYVNDFELSDPRPWKIPARFEMTPDLEPVKNEVANQDEPQIEWQTLQNGLFQNVYEDIMQDIRSGLLEKSVPVLTERGRLLKGNLETLIHSVDHLPAPYFSYGFRLGASGCIGASPELLFALHGHQLTTMALAGTAPTSQETRFEKDEKEINEHEFVAEYLIQKLGGLGIVDREPRKLLTLGTIAHFHSPIHVDLEQPQELDSLIRLMHPTPALGSFPRNKVALGKLKTYRAQLKAPPRFGAPFGVWVEGAFHAVVAIRNISWHDEDVFLPSGVGVVRKSVFENEWRELELKRNAVRETLGL